MGRRDLILLLLVVFAATSHAHDPGQLTLDGVSQSNVPLNCSGGPLELAPADFACACTAFGPSCTLDPGIGRSGSCVGEAADFCGTVSFSGKDVTNLRTSDSVRFGDIATTPTARVEATAPSSTTAGVYKADVTGTATTNVLGFNFFPGGITLGAGGAISAAKMDGTTVTLNADPSAFGWFYFFLNRPTIRNLASTAITAAPMHMLYMGPTLTADNAALSVNDFSTLPAYAALVHQPVFSRVGTPTQTAQTITGFWSAGTVGAGWTVTSWTPIKIDAPSVSGAITTLRGIHLGNYTQGSTNISLQSDGGQMRHAGSAIFGVSSAAPTGYVTVQQPTIGSEVTRFESVATNDDPNLRLFQARATAAASATTNIDFNLTTAACPASNVCTVEAAIVCHCTSGSSCTTNQGGGITSRWVVKNNGGTITQIGTAASGNVVGSTFAHSADASLTSITQSISTPNLRLAVVVPANYNHTCHVNYSVQNVGT